MAFSLIPDRVYSSIFEIDGTELSRRGVSLLLADLDNTLAKYGQPDPEPAVQQWKCGLAEAGVELFLLSNSRKPARAGHYARCLEVPYLGHAGKPRTEGFFRAMEQMGQPSPCGTNPIVPVMTQECKDTAFPKSSAHSLSQSAVSPVT